MEVTGPGPSPGLRVGTGIAKECFLSSTRRARPLCSDCSLVFVPMAQVCGWLQPQTQ